MPAYSYTALDARGKKKIKDSVEASSIESAKNSLRAAGYTILEIKEQSALNKEINVPFIGKPSSKDMAVFCRQFVSILRAGVSISTVLSMLTQQTENKQLAAALRDMHADIEKGESLAGSMRKQKKVFSPILINMVAAGEASGNLEDSFVQMEAYYDKLTKTKGKVGKVMIYPCILLVVMIVVLIVMMTRIIPSFLNTFREMDAQLPKLTQGVMAVSDWFVAWWWLLAIIIAVLVIGGMAFNKTSKGKHFFAKLALKLPIVGKLVVRSASATFCRTLSLLLASGITLTDSLELAATNMSNILFADAVRNTKLLVSEGWTLNAALVETRLFPPMVYNLAGIGEETGELQEMLTKTADFYDQEVNDSTDKLLALMEPAIILLMAGFVIIIVLSIFLPMLQMTSAYDKYLK